MKKTRFLFIYLFIATFFLGCTKQMPIDNGESKKVGDENNLTLAVIQKIALEHMNSLQSSDLNKNGRESCEVDTSFFIKDKKGKNAINVFKFKNNKGWNIISGDNRFHPVLAYNVSGEAKLDTSLNIGLKYWVEDILAQIEFLDSHKIGQDEKIKFQWDKYLEENSSLKYEPIDTPTCPSTNTYWRSWNSSTSEWGGFTQLEWNQSGGFNYYMDEDNCNPYWTYYDRFPVGCGPVAMGMLMHYYQKPYNFIFENNYRIINYGLMPNSISPGNVNCSDIQDPYEEVAALLRNVSGKYGHKVPCLINANVYVYPNDIVQTFSDWGYSNSGDKIGYYDNPNHTRLISNLKQNKPVIFYGSNCDLCYSNAHYWVCEGLHENVDNLCSTYRWVYMNWGHGGANDGWFVLSNQFTVVDYEGNSFTYDNAHMKIYVDITP
jgi:hypothetical protein